MQPANTDLGLIVGGVQLAGDLHRFFVEAGFVERLCVVHLVILNVWLLDHQLLVAVGGGHKVLHLVVAVAQQGQRRSRLQPQHPWAASVTLLLTRAAILHLSQQWRRCAVAGQKIKKLSPSHEPVGHIGLRLDVTIKGAEQANIYYPLQRSVTYFSQIRDRSGDTMSNTPEP